MAVYVDNMQRTLGRMKMCHMIADTRKELFAMVDKIGVKRMWIQDFNQPREHFDISLAKRELAVNYGAKEVGPKDIVRVTGNRIMEDYTK
jgi:hypothetical protein